MGSEVVQAHAAAQGQARAAEGSGADSAPPIAAGSVLVISRDPVERQAVVLQLGGVDMLAASSASGFHMAVPLMWSNPPDVIVLGALTPTDEQHLPELRRHAPEARIVVLGVGADAYAELRPDARVPLGGDVVGALAGLLPG